MNIRELFDMMERTDTRLVCKKRNLVVKMVSGQYRFVVFEGWREKYVGYNLAQALLVLEGDDE